MFADFVFLCTALLRTIVTLARYKSLSGTPLRLIGELVTLKMARIQATPLQKM